MGFLGFPSGSPIAFANMGFLGFPSSSSIAFANMGFLGFSSGSSIAFANMDVKCHGCFNITTVFSHSQTVVVYGNYQTVLCQPTRGRARLTEGCSFQRKGD
ncbi:hypothetical protein CUMW_266330 [Citrus unshiu]|uniref:Uncharacterized protein n=1 Tax=Citrus unshiu TaxID=55188 RepID=A0A2H5QVQ6_CITUN|nr:hypothetical protein CUMW_266330 [Citrus unshiu]